MKRTVLKMLRDAASKYPNTDYVLDKGESKYEGRKFSVIQKESEALAIKLMENGFEKGDRVAILAEGRSSWVTSEFGILKAGCISVPLSIKLLPEEVLFRLNHSGSKAIVATKNTFEKVAAIWDKIEAQGFKLIYLDNELDHLQKKCTELGIQICDSAFSFDKWVSEGLADYDEKFPLIQKMEDNIAEDDVVTISYTSGTTGNPKGIMLTHLNYYSNSKDAMAFFNVNEKSRVLIILPLDHSFAHTVGIYASLERGLSIYFVDARGGGAATLRNIPINMKEASPHFMLTVPALSGNFMKKIQDGIQTKGGFAKWLFYKGMRSRVRMQADGWSKPGLPIQIWNWAAWKLADLLVYKKVRQIFGTNLEFFVGGGALLDVKQQRFFNAIGIPIYQGYGLTEATPIISSNTPDNHKFGSSGMILPTIKTRIVDDNGNDLAPGIKGELVIEGNNVMKGYFKNDKATAVTVRGKELFTGDLGWIDKDNFLIIVGREKALLISQDGEKYSPEEIEEAIMTSGDLIAQAMIYNDHNRYTTAVITLDDARVHKFVKENRITDHELLLKEIRRSFYKFRNEEEYKNVFPEKWIPSTFRIVGELFTEQNFMINSTMKMVRYRITETYKHLITDMYETEGTNVVVPSNSEVVKKFLPF